MFENKTKTFLLLTLIFITMMGVSVVSAADSDDFTADTTSIVEDTTTQNVDNNFQSDVSTENRQITKNVKTDVKCDADIQTDITNSEDKLYEKSKTITKTENVYNLNNVKTQGQVYVLNDANWSVYFEDDGKLKDSVLPGSELQFEGVFNERVMVIKNPVNITTAPKQAVLNNCSFIITCDSVNITKLQMNSQDKEDYLILIEDSNNVNIIENTLELTNNEDYETRSVMIDGGSDILLKDNVITTVGPEKIVSYAPDNSIETLYLASIESTGNKVTFDGNRITTRKNDNDDEPYGTLMGLYVHGEDSDNKISDIKIIDNDINTIGHLYTYGIKPHYIENSLIESNKVTGESNLYSSGIHAFVISDTLIKDNIIIGNTINMTYGITLEGAMNINVLESTENTNVTNNVINLESKLSWAIEAYASKNNIIEYNNITVLANNGLGIGVSDQGTNVSYNNIEVTSIDLNVGTLSYDYIDPYTTGIKVTDSGISTCSDNTITFNNIIVNAPENTISAVNITYRAQNTIVTDNYLISPLGKGDNAVINYSTTSTIINNEPTTTVKDTVITIEDIGAVKKGETVTIRGTLTDIDGNAIANRVVKLSINGSNKTLRTDSEGKFTHTYTLNRIGETSITATFAGTDEYDQASATITVEVKPFATIIVIDPIDPVEKGTTVTITGTLSDENGNKLANRVVKLSINGSNKTLRTDSEGIFTHTYTLNRIGETSITATFAGTDEYDQASATITVEVKPLATIIVIDPIDPVEKGTTVTITGTLSDENGNAIANAVVKLSINGSNKTLKTDSEGKFTHTYTLNRIGETSITATFAGNKNYQSAENTTIIEVIKMKTTITLEHDDTVDKGSNVTFTGKLTDSKGNAIANAQIKITINGSSKTLKTGNTGMYTHTFKMIKEGTNNITVSYKGNIQYSETETNSTIEVL